MTAQSLPTRLWHEACLYGSVARGFRRNTKLYLFSIPMMGPGMQAFGVLFNLYLLQLGFDEVLIGQTIAATALGTMVGGIPSGMLYNRVGGRWSFSLGILLIALTRLVLLLVVTPLPLIVVSFFGGIANAIISTVWLPFMADETNEHERTYLFSLNDMLWTIAEMVGSLLGGFAPALFMTYLALTTMAISQRISMIVALDLSLLSLIPILAMRTTSRLQDEEAEQIKPEKPKKGMAISRRRGFVGSACVIFFVGLIMGIGGFQNVYFSEFHKASDGQIGLFFALSRVTGLISISTLPSIANRLGLVKTNLLFGIVTAPFFFLLGFPLPLLGAVPIFLVGYGLFRANWMLYFNLVMEVVPPRDRGTQAGLRVVSAFLASSIAGVAGGWIIVQMGYGLLFSVSALASLAAGGLTWFFFRGTSVDAPRG